MHKQTERKRVCSIYLFVVFFNILRIESLVVTRREERTARERELALNMHLM